MDFKKIESHIKNELSTTDIPNENLFDDWDDLATQLDQIHPASKRRAFIIYLYLVGLALLTGFLQYTSNTDTQGYIATKANLAEKQEQKANNNTTIARANTTNRTQESNRKEAVIQVESASKAVAKQQSNSYFIAPKPMASTTALQINKYSNNISLAPNLLTDKRFTNNTTSFSTSNTTTKTLAFSPIQRTTVSLLAGPDLQPVSSQTTNELLAPISKTLSVVETTAPTMSIGFGAGLQQSNWPLKAKQNSEYSNFREELEQGLPSIQMGIHLKKPIGKQWQIGIGLQYAEHRSKASFNDVVQDSVLKTNVLIKYLRNSLTGEIVDEVYGDVKVARSTHVNFVNYNSYDQLKIPIGLIYSKQKKRVNTYLQLGITAGFWLKQEATVLDEDLELLKLSGQAEQLTPNAIVWSAHCQYTFAYKLNKQLAAYTSLQLENALSNWMATDANYKLRPTSLGVSIGLQYDL